MEAVTWIVFCLSSLIQVACQTQNDKHSALYCRDSWMYNISYPEFAVYSCSKCFVQVFFNEKNLKIMFPPTYPYLLYENISDPNSATFYPDAEAEQLEVCAHSLTSDECQEWRDCCQAARRCCLETQQEDKLDRQKNSCPATWDGISCWAATPADHPEQQSCPNYYVLNHVTWSSPYVTRHCESDGTWRSHPDTHQEFSDYKQCYDENANIRILKVSLYIDFIGNAISIIFLVSSIIVILTFRELRTELQNRTGLKIHFNLFVSVLCTAGFTVAFNAIYHDAFTNSNPVYKHNAIWCRALHIMTKYFQSTTYMCMFCEGLFLYRRISQVMQIGITETLLKYLLISWVLPVVTIGVYVTVRMFLGHNERCWIDAGLSALEYIHMIPNLCSLVCNLMFLVSIQYMLCMKIRQEQKLRHAIRATMSLIPIFGLQFLFLIYRPKDWPPYEIIVAIFQSTQGTLVAILYCFTTREVKSVIASTLQSCRRRHRNSFTQNTATRATRFVNSPRQRANYMGNGVQSVPNKKPEPIRPNHSLPDVVDCRIYLEPTSPRRDSDISKTTQCSFTGGSGTSINSQPVSKIDLNVSIDKTNRLSNKNGMSNCSQSNQLKNGGYHNTPSPVTFTIDDLEQTTPLIELNVFNKTNTSPVTDSAISPILSPILEAESHSNASSS